VLAEESQFFRDLFELPNPDSTEGLSDYHPIQPGLSPKKDDFRQLLKLLFP
jgi:hypothetical protein